VIAQVVKATAKSDLKLEPRIVQWHLALVLPFIHNSLPAYGTSHCYCCDVHASDRCKARRCAGFGFFQAPHAREDL
jgi:hypothetical protein